MAEAVSLPCQIVQALRVGGQVVGRIYVAYTQERDFLDEESAILGDITRRVSGYIENRRLLQETQARAEELAILNEMARTLTAMLDMETVIENIYHHTSRLLDTTNFYVALYDAEQDEVSFPLYAEGEQIRRAGRRRVGKGLTECVIRTREPVLVKENLDQWLEEQGIEPIGREAQSWLGVPMMIGEQVIGVIAVQSYTTPRLYDEHHRDLLTAIASQAAIALENARLFQQTQASLEQVQAVHQRYLRESWQDYLDARGRAAQPAYLYDQAQIKPLPALQSSEIDRALTQKELILADGEEGRQTIAVPISLRGQPIGALAVESPPGGRPWNEEEIALVESVATQLALAIENARLFEQTLRRAHRERLVREITDKIRGQTGLDAILQTTVRELGKALGTSRTAIRLGTESELLSPSVEHHADERQKLGR
jgi:GAF domain-containing protein